MGLETWSTDHGPRSTERSTAYWSKDTTPENGCVCCGLRNCGLLTIDRGPQGGLWSVVRLNVNRVVHEHLFPKVRVVLYELLMNGMYLVNVLTFEVIEENKL
jgi:hypothetical protein